MARKLCELHTPALKLQVQRSDGDCCIASLATLTGISYEDILIEAAKEQKKPHADGLFFTDLMRIAKRVNYPLRKKKVNFLKDIGLLDVRLYSNSPNMNLHCVVLMAGMIYDMSDGTVWLPQEFKKRYRAQFGAILVPIR